LTRVPSQTVEPPRALECPIHLEASVAAKHGIMDDDEAVRGAIVAFEVRIQRVHLHPGVLMNGNPDRIDPDKWRPLIMSFQRFYGLGDELHDSILARIPEEAYRPLARIPELALASDDGSRS
jgi:flavin reductase (DIM6/NTAB) family NADH-FMN oxidoreductase RutF